MQQGYGRACFPAGSTNALESGAFQPMLRTDVDADHALRERQQSVDRADEPGHRVLEAAAGELHDGRGQHLALAPVRQLALGAHHSNCAGDRDSINGVSWYRYSGQRRDRTDWLQSGLLLGPRLPTRPHPRTATRSRGNRFGNLLPALLMALVSLVAVLR